MECAPSTVAAPNLLFGFTVFSGRAAVKIVLSRLVLAPSLHLQFKVFPHCPLPLTTSLVLSPCNEPASILICFLIISSLSSNCASLWLPDAAILPRPGLTRRACIAIRPHIPATRLRDKPHAPPPLPLSSPIIVADTATPPPTTRNSFLSHTQLGVARDHRNHGSAKQRRTPPVLRSIRPRRRTQGAIAAWHTTTASVKEERVSSGLA